MIHVGDTVNVYNRSIHGNALFFEGYAKVIRIEGAGPAEIDARVRFEVDEDDVTFRRRISFVGQGCNGEVWAKARREAEKAGTAGELPATASENGPIGPNG